MSLIDFKRRASGERDELEDLVEHPDDQLELDPQHERRAAVRELGRSTGQLMLDDMTKPKAPVPAEHRKPEPMPSDREWRGEIEKIFRKDG